MIVSSQCTVNIGESSVLSRTFIFGDNQQIAVALYTHEASPQKFLRVQYGCLLGNIFGSRDCDCNFQTQAALSLILREGGIFIYFRDHEALGLGIFQKAELLALEQTDKKKHIKVLTDIHGNRSRHSVLNFVPEILRHIGSADEYVLLGSNKEKLKILQSLAIPVFRLEALRIDETKLSDFARAELDWKSGI